MATHELSKGFTVPTSKKKQKSPAAASRARRSSKPRTERRSERKKTGLAEKCSRLLGETVESMEYPGGRKRRSIRLILASGECVVASTRPKLSRARKERMVLRKLHAEGAHVPRLLASDREHLLIQENIPGPRLSEAMHRRDAGSIAGALNAALTSLADTQRAGSALGLDTRLETLGRSFDWLVGLLNRPAVVGNHLGVKARRPNLKALEELLAIRKPRFVKWDARPGNAILKSDGTVAWFDWEHCGARNRLDDVAWLLCDEHVPELPLVESELIDRHLHRFADDLSADEAAQYLSAYGVFHISVRIGLICKYKLRDGWWDHDYCVKRDKVGISWENMRRLCERGERWAKRNPYTESLVPWFPALAGFFSEQDRKA